MSKEATGQYGAKLGSSEYWSRVNHATILGGFMGAETSYQAILRELGQRASAAIEEIHGDLSNLGSRIRYLSASDRNTLAKQVEGLYDVCKMSGVSPRHSSECVQGLNLSIMSPWSSGFRDERGIERAVSIIQKSPYSSGEAVSLLREAAKWSISFASGSDRTKQTFLEAVAQGNLSSRFLQDVADEYENQNGSHRLEGGCGHTVGSRAYLTYVELQVFGTALPSLICAASGNPDYEKLIKDALNSVADQLSRDLDNAARENDYITDETADRLKAVVDELARCGVSTGALHSKIEKLAWFVGGDPSKIEDLQKALNDLGVGQSLKEDGVYGEKTKTALDSLIDKVPDFLNNPNNLRLFAVAVDAVAAVDVAVRSKMALDKAIKKSWRLLLNVIWDFVGVELILRPKDCQVAILLLQHSLKTFPSDLRFLQSHFVTQKIIGSNRFRQVFCELEKKIQENPELYAVDGSVGIDFQGSSGDTDLYYGIGKCKLKYTCTRYPTSVRVKFTIEDRYDFDHIRTIRMDMGGLVTDFGLGSLANDAGLLSQKTDVISPYHIYIEFEKTIELS